MRGRFSLGSSSIPLEVELQRNLHQTGPAGLADLAKCSVEPKVIRIQELGVVESIEHLRTELERLRFGDLGLFQE